MRWLPFTSRRTQLGKVIHRWYLNLLESSSNSPGADRFKEPEFRGKCSVTLPLVCFPLQYCPFKAFYCTHACVFLLYIAIETQNTPSEGVQSIVLPLFSFCFSFLFLSQTQFCSFAQQSEGVVILKSHSPVFLSATVRVLIMILILIMLSLQ